MAQYHIKLHNEWLRIKNFDSSKTICVFNLRMPIIYHHQNKQFGIWASTDSGGYVSYDHGYYREKKNIFDCRLSDEQNKQLYEFIEEHLMEGIDVERII